MVRLHSECLTGDVFGSMRCECGSQIDEAMKFFAQHGGILLYMRQEGRDIGLYNKIEAYALQDTGLDTFEANIALGLPEDNRDFRASAEMLQALGCTRIHLLTNNPLKCSSLQEAGIHIQHRQSTGYYPTLHNQGYLDAKQTKGGHLWT